MNAVAAPFVRAPAPARTISSYFAASGPTPEWDELAWWPPDVFALANLILDHTEGYRFVVAPSTGRRWPPLPDWNERVHAAARAWRESGPAQSRPLPRFLVDRWQTVSQARDTPLDAVQSGAAWEVNEALLTLHAVADEACADVAGRGRPASAGSFERRAWNLLRQHGSLSRLSPARVRVVPKTHVSAHGITIRSLSRYLALCYESVDVHWQGGSEDPPRSSERCDYTMLLVPWPLSIAAHEFRSTIPQVLENMDSGAFGFFEFAPHRALDLELLSALLEAAVAEAGKVDAVIFPEAAVAAQEIPDLEGVLDQRKTSFLIAGVRQPRNSAPFGRNYLHIGLRGAAGWERLEQDKHHRWFLDSGQLRQYHLTRSLDPRKLWWEAIDIRERKLHIVDIGNGVTTASLVCEDLARLDEVADLVRRIGPSLVIALLLDGPQLSARWPCRYASILVDEPGSTVLTLTSYGMAARCRPPGKRHSRVVAHWHSKTDGLHEIELAPRASGVLLTAALDRRMLWTADGRAHPDVPGLSLREVRQLRVGH